MINESLLETSRQRQYIQAMTGIRLRLVANATSTDKENPNALKAAEIVMRLRMNKRQARQSVPNAVTGARRHTDADVTIGGGGGGGGSVFERDARPSLNTSSTITAHRGERARVSSLVTIDTPEGARAHEFDTVMNHFKSSVHARARALERETDGMQHCRLFLAEQQRDLARVRAAGNFQMAIREQASRSPCSPGANSVHENSTIALTQVSLQGHHHTHKQQQQSALAAAAAVALTRPSLTLVPNDARSGKARRRHFDSSTITPGSPMSLPRTSRKADDDLQSLRRQKKHNAEESAIPDVDAFFCGLMAANMTPQQLQRQVTAATAHLEEVHEQRTKEEIMRLMTPYNQRIMREVLEVQLQDLSKELRGVDLEVEAEMVQHNMVQATMQQQQLIAHQKARLERIQGATKAYLAATGAPRQSTHTAAETGAFNNARSRRANEEVTRERVQKLAQQVQILNGVREKTAADFQKTIITIENNRFDNIREKLRLLDHLRRGTGNASNGNHNANNTSGHVLNRTDGGQEQSPYMDLSPRGQLVIRREMKQNLRRRVLRNALQITNLLSIMRTLKACSYPIHDEVRNVFVALRAYLLEGKLANRTTLPEICRILNVNWRQYAAVQFCAAHLFDKSLGKVVTAKEYIRDLNQVNDRSRPRAIKTEFYQDL